MTIDVTLNNVATFQNDTSAVTIVNANMASIATAFDDALSISGTIPNQMHSNIDMNSNRLLNLPSPIAMTEPLRVVDADILNGGGTISVAPLPTGGTINQVLTKNSSTNFDASWENVVITGNILPAQLPALVGDVTSTVGTATTAIASGAVSNAKMANMPAFSIKANPSSSSATPTDITIGALVQKSSPVSSDQVMISDSAAAGALKYATVGSIGTVGSVASIGGSAGAITLGGDLSISSNVLQDSFTTGDIKLTLKSSADTGWVLFADQTIGNTGSGANFASTQAQALYTLLWTNVSSPTSNTYAPVTGGLGANAAADWAANKPMLMLKTLGRALALAGSGASLTSRSLGSNVGEETHLLITGEMPSHTHTVNDPGHSHIFRMGDSTTGGSLPYAGSVDNSTGTIDGATTGISIVNTGGGGSHNNMQPSTFLNAMIKL